MLSCKDVEWSFGFSDEESSFMPKWVLLTQLGVKCVD
jgi:hypothetical protein